MCQRKEDPGKPWGFEAKEFLRKMLIGFKFFLFFIFYYHFLVINKVFHIMNTF
jgi:hypothetical protein